VTAAGRFPRRGRSGIVPVCVALAFCAFAVVMLGYSPSLNPFDVLTGSGFRVKVADVVGLTQTRALVVLQDHDLEGRTRFAVSLTVPPGRVISQRPGAGDTAARGGQVTLVVSRGKSQVETPKVERLPLTDAKRALDDAGLTYRTEMQNHEDVPKGAVIRQTPVPGEVVVGGTQVTLVVSLGPAPRTVPDVARLPLEGALYRLGRAGFTLGKVTSIDDPKLPANAVISTSPNKGEIRDRDTPVDVVVSNGPTPVTLPNLLGKTFADASASLSKLGIIVAQHTTATTPDDPDAGKVTGQSPSPGAPIRPGEVVTLEVKEAE
jgi:serine/threonine-protein kinase